MSQLSSEAIIASFISDDRLRGFQLQADGTLTEITRPTLGSVWSPPTDAAKLQGGYEPFLVAWNQLSQ